MNEAKLLPPEMAQRIAPGYPWRDEVFAFPERFVSEKLREEIAGGEMIAEILNHTNPTSGGFANGEKEQPTLLV